MQPIEVGLRLTVALYTFFPLVSELASEIATGVFMKQSQVRVVGANAAEDNPDKTIVLIDLLPLGEKFDYTTANFTFQRFWQKQVVINVSYFDDYFVLYVRYPGKMASFMEVVFAKKYSSRVFDSFQVKLKWLRIRSWWCLAKENLKID